MKRDTVFDLIEPAPVGAQTLESEAEEWRALDGVTVPVTVAIPCDLIDPNPHQPRQDFDQAKLEELAGSIKEHGVIQPIVVEPNGERFTLHAGERRLRASRLANLSEIPAYIVPPGGSPQSLLVRAVVENVQRADMNPLELAKAFQEMAEMGLSDSEIAKQVGKSRSVVANTRRLLNLPEERQAQVAAGQLNERQALALLPLYALPANIQEKVLESWDGKKLANPTSMTSDQIRSSLNSAIRSRGQEISLIEADQVFTGDGIHHPTCTGCDLYVKVGQSMICLDKVCLTAKQNQAIAAYLEQAKAATGLNYLDPALELKYNQTDGFDGTSGAQALSAALEAKCANLRLDFRRRSWDYGAGPDAFDKCRYRCFHDGEGCACAGALKAAREAERKANEQAIGQLADQAINHMAQIIKDNHPNLLRTILNTMLTNYYGGDNKTHKLKPAQVIRKLAEQLIERNAKPSTYRSLEVNQQAIDTWLDKMSLPPMATDPVAELDRQLSRIEDWIVQLHNPARPEHLEAIRGNLTNLAKLAEEIVTLERSAELWTRYDAAKSKLLAKREEAEAATGPHLKSIKENLDDLESKLKELVPQAEEAAA